MSSIFRLFLVLLVAARVGYAQDFTLLSSGDKSIRFVYKPVLQDSSIIVRNGKDYTVFAFQSCDEPAVTKPGMPAINARSIKIGVPTIEGNTLTIVRKTARVSTAIIPPIPGLRKSKGISESDFVEGREYSNPGLFPSSVALLKYTGIMRGLPVAEVAIYPVRFDPVTATVEILTEIEIEISFGKRQYSFSQGSDHFLENSVINYPVAKKWGGSDNPARKTLAQNSVLATGKWFRFEAKTEGIYRITREMISSLGVNPDEIDPKTFKIYNNGGKVLPEQVNAPRPADLVENAIYVAGEEDRKFNTNDYILFYGRGVSFWQYDSVSAKMRRNYTPYSFENYYWITWGGNAGKRMTLKSSLSIAAPTVQTTTDAYLHWEQDKINIGKTGREFFGDEFSETMKSRSYTNKLDGLNTSRPVSYTYRFVNASSPDVLLQVEENGISRISKNLSGYGYYEYSYGEDDQGSFTHSGPFSDGRSILRFTFNATGAGTFGYLDYFEIKYLRDLSAIDYSLLFFSAGLDGIFEYRLTNFTPAQVLLFDISDYANVQMVVNPVPPAGSEFTFQASESRLKVSKYFALEPQAYKTPVNFREMPNQNLHGLSPGVKYVIIAPPQFKEQAERLRKFRASESKVTLSSAVFYTDDIYNEFSCGAKEPTAIRDFIRYAYLNWNTRPEYILFFGDGDYDYRNIEGNNLNHIPAYETQESLDEIDSYNTDDYYVRVDGNDVYPDVAFGRLPVQSNAESEIAVDKIIAYEKSSDFSLWRNRITLVADDGYVSRGFEGSDHTDQSESLSTYTIPQSFDIRKLYLADYPTAFTSLGRRKPDVNAALINTLNEGTLLLNYYGHGSPELWAHEQVFVKDESFPLLKNKNYFFLTAATCDFGYFDKTLGQSASEVLVLKQNSGAIGVISATRPVFSTSNHALNQDIYSSLLLADRDTLNLSIPIGKAFFNAKRYKTGDNDFKFHLFCDPGLRLAIPEYTGFIDSINGLSATSDVSVKALQKLRLNGRISLDGASTANSFNGDATLSVFDSERQKNLPEFGSSYMIRQQGGTIFRGGISVVNGKFYAEFLVPRDISLENRNGKITLYFKDGVSDGLIFSKKIIFSGVDTTTSNDGAGPEIQVAFDNENYTDAYLVNPNSVLVVKIKDETGLNTTGNGIGHKMLAVLNNNQREPIDLTNYFTADMNSGGKSGKAEYPFKNLAHGEYQLEVKAWDVFNNPGIFKTAFKVTNTSSLSIENVYNYPNPFSAGTTFILDHNAPEAVNLKIKIFTVAGRLVKVIERQAVNERNILVDWDGKDDDGSLLANGTYLYKVNVTSLIGGGSRAFNGKLSIIR